MSHGDISAKGWPFSDLWKSVEDMMEADVLYFPVRHHSPVCSWHLQKIIASYQPVEILIEGPSDAQEVIPFLNHPDNIFPLAVFCSFTDDKDEFGLNGKFTPHESIPYRFSSLSPFAEYSPELVAIKEGLKRKIPLFFIDLPFYGRLRIQKQVSNEITKKNVLIEENLNETILSRQFETVVAKQGRFRDFNEFWNHYFEIEGLKISTTEFLKRLLIYAAFSRKSLDQSFLDLEIIKPREEFMATFIQQRRKVHKERILVVTGAAHSVALPYVSKMRKLPKKILTAPKSFQRSLIPFSFFRLSNHSGYHAGMANPLHCQLIWDSLKKGIINPHTQVARNLLISTEKTIRLRTKNNFSPADTISALVLATNLAALRGRHEISPEDLFDSIQSTLIKGEIHYHRHYLDAIRHELFIGDQVGVLSKGLGEIALQEDFYRQLKRHRIRLKDGKLEQTLRVDIYKSERHRQKSKFLHQCLFLDLPFASIIKGPDPYKRRNMHLLTEQWKVSLSGSLNNKLVDLSPKGATIAEAAMSHLWKIFQTDAIHDIRIIGEVVFRSAQMGLQAVFNKALKELKKLINPKQEFLSLVEALNLIYMLYTMREAIITPGYNLLAPILTNIYNQSVLNLINIQDLTFNSRDEIIDKVRTLVYIAFSEEIELDKSLLQTICMRALKQNPNSLLSGIFTGILYSFHAISDDEIIKLFTSYSRGLVETEKAGSEFLEGLFLFARGVLLVNQDLLLKLSIAIEGLSDDIFIRLLPNFRRAFSPFVPKEIETIAHKLSHLNEEERSIGIFRKSFHEPEIVTAFEALDEEIYDYLREWNIK